MRNGGHRDGGPLPELRVLTAPMVESHIQIPIIVEPKIVLKEATYIDHYTYTFLQTLKLP